MNIWPDAAEWSVLWDFAKAATVWLGLALLFGWVVGRYVLRDLTDDELDDARDTLDRELWNRKWEKRDDRNHNL